MGKFKFDYSSRFRILKGGKISLVVSAMLGGATLLSASPSGGNVVSGSATINQSGKITTINQSTQRASINWQDFSIKNDETVNFNQPDVNSITLNRVIGNEKSIIDGALNANGQVWILNSNGVLFGKSASVNTAGILATTKSLSDEDFQNGNYNLKGDSKASVVNQGTIDISDSGYAVMLADSVTNEGEVRAVKGSVHFTGASEATINLNGNSLVNLKVDKGVLDALVENKGAVYADGGEIYLTTNAVDELLKGVVNNEGILEAQTLDGLKGKIEVFAHEGTAYIAGTLDASAPNGGDGGFIETSGATVKIADGTVVTTKSFDGEFGTWLIDPTDFVVSDGPDADMTATDLASSLENGTVMILSTNGNNAGDGNIYIKKGFSWNAATNLVLNAENSIYFQGIEESININNNASLIALYYGSNQSEDAGYFFNGMSLNFSDTPGAVRFKTYNFANGLGEIDYKLVNALGSEGDELTANNFTLQGLANADMLGGNYIIGSDIEITASSTWNADEGFVPIGAYNLETPLPFSGRFEGAGHYIYNDVLPGYGKKSLFGQLDHATISNAVFKVNVSTYGAYGAEVYGGLGRAISNSHINNIYVFGRVEGGSRSKIGGLFGSSFDSTYKNNTSQIVLYGAHTTGGLVGDSMADIIVDSEVSGNIQGSYYKIGGLIGQSERTSIENSFYSGDITAVGLDDFTVLENIGGLVGNATDTYINNSYSSGSIVSDGSSADGTVYEYMLYNTGGLVGRMYSADVGGYSIRNSHSNMIINNSFNNVGGLVGLLENTSILDSYADGEIHGGNAASHYNPIGGLVGQMVSGTVDRSYSETVFGQMEPYYIGGIAGVATRASLIKDSYSKSDIPDIGKDTGGLVGYLTGSRLENSYLEAGSIGGVRTVGGLVGFASGGEIINSYINGDILLSGGAGGTVGSIAGSLDNTLVQDTNERYLENTEGLEIISLDGYPGILAGEIYESEIRYGNAEEIHTLLESYDFFKKYFSLIYPDYGDTSVIYLNVPHESTSTTETTSATDSISATDNDSGIEKIVTTIVNATATKVDSPKIITSLDKPQMEQIKTQKFNLGLGDGFSLVSQPFEQEPTQTVTLSELKQKQANQDKAVLSQEFRVALGKNSLIDLVNGGVNLPDGVEQEFYIVEENN